eukprot:gene16162-biopygen9395
MEYVVAGTSPVRLTVADSSEAKANMPCDITAANEEGVVDRAMAGRMAVLMAAVMAAVTVVMWDMRTVGWTADSMVDRMALTSDGSAAAVTADPTEQRTAVPMAASKAVELAAQMDGPMGFPLVHHWVASWVG